MLYQMVKLATFSQELPPSLYIRGVDLGGTRDPTYPGGFSDVFRATYQGEPVAVKRMRVYVDESGDFYKASHNASLTALS
jgi:hypothetical protein